MKASRCGGSSVFLHGPVCAAHDITQILVITDSADIQCGIELVQCLLGIPSASEKFSAEKLSYRKKSLASWCANTAYLLGEPPELRRGM
jgi:hypothetical protein